MKIIGLICAAVLACTPIAQAETVWLFAHANNDVCVTMVGQALSEGKHYRTPEEFLRSFAVPDLQIMPVYLNDEYANVARAYRTYWPERKLTSEWLFFSDRASCLEYWRRQLHLNMGAR